MSINEIGSEFWLDHAGSQSSADWAADTAILLSGRTALDFVCRDSEIKSITLPSYCCETMIEPFLRNGVQVHFYDVNINGIACSELQDDAVLVIDYFGYANPSAVCLAERARANGKIVIYDRTHRLLGNSVIEAYADYSILSYRKWTYCNFATAKKVGAPWRISFPTETNDAYIALRDQAAQKKADYITKSIGEKQLFLSLFGQANALLADAYVNRAGKPVPIPVDDMVAQRRENAAVLMNGLSKMEQIDLWFPTLNEKDTPLFVPILVKDAEMRKCLREHLSKNQIYCPIHWPKSTHVTSASNELYQRELSLICDQRYNRDDMLRQISVIETFLNR